MNAETFSANATNRDIETNDEDILNNPNEKREYLIVVEVNLYSTGY